MIQSLTLNLEFLKYCSHTHIRESLKHLHMCHNAFIYVPIRIDTHACVAVHVTVRIVVCVAACAAACMIVCIVVCAAMRVAVRVSVMPSIFKVCFSECFSVCQYALTHTRP